MIILPLGSTPLLNGLRFRNKLYAKVIRLIRDSQSLLDKYLGKPHVFDESSLKRTMTSIIENIRDYISMEIFRNASEMFAEFYCSGNSDYTTLNFILKLPFASLDKRGTHVHV